MTVGTSNGDREAVRVRLPADVLDRLDESVRRGNYESRGDVVGEAIRRAAEE